MKLTIKTNYHWRDFIYGYELSDTEKTDFDYIQDEDLDSQNFIRYRGMVYDPGEFMRTPDNTTMRCDHPEFCSWDGYQSDSYFSGVLIRYSKDCEQYQIATYMS